MDDNLTWQQLEMEKAFSSSGFVLKTQFQISKDFARHGFGFSPDFESVAYDSGRLHETVRLMLAEIAEKSPSRWLPLMYSLDISEKNYVRFFESSHADWLSEFAWVVIRREAQKVFFREMLK